jgi:Tfp pilus assembly protein FimV
MNNRILSLLCTLPLLTSIAACCGGDNKVTSDNSTKPARPAAGATTTAEATTRAAAPAKPHAAAPPAAATAARVQPTAAPLAAATAAPMQAAAAPPAATAPVQPAAGAKSFLAASPSDPTAGAGRGGFGVDGLPADIPATRSKVPTLAEWDAVPREISVARSTPLGCETKMVREWLRVSCRKRNSTGGMPTNVETRQSGGVEAFTFAKNSITSLVVPVLRGRHYVAQFSWTDHSELLIVEWANGAPRPRIFFGY